MLLRHVAHPEEFKMLCDGLLRAEYAGLVSTFGASGRDRGVDAMLVGAIGGESGTWVFQYKFVGAEDADRARSRILGYFRHTKTRASEFQKVKHLNPVGYVLLTNAPLSAGAHSELAQLAREFLPSTRFITWDSSAVNAMLRGREYLLQAISTARHESARSVAREVYTWLNHTSEAALFPAKEPMWPLELHNRTALEPSESIAAPVREVNKWESDIDNLVLAVMKAPAFEYASTVVFPNAFTFLTGTVEAINSLLESVRKHTFALSVALPSFDPVFRDYVGGNKRVETVPLAYAVLHAAWGRCDALLSFSGPNEDGVGVVRMHGVVVYEGLKLREIREALDRQLGLQRQHAAAREVRALRQRVADVLELAYRAVWYPAELGLDCPAPYTRDMRPPPMAGLPLLPGDD